MTQFLPAPLLMHAWRNERSLKENHLVKCIHYTGEEKKEQLVCWYSGDVFGDVFRDVLGDVSTHRSLIIPFSITAATQQLLC